MLPCFGLIILGLSEAYFQVMGMEISADYIPGAGRYGRVNNGKGKCERKRKEEKYEKN
jgi:hypothetical protein